MQWNFCHRLVVVGIILLKNTDGAIAARDINALARTVIKNIVGVSRAVQAGHRFTGFGVEDDECRWFSKPDKQSVMPLVERHWKVGRSVRGRPYRGYGSFLPVHNHYLLGRRNIYEDTWPGPLYLEGFRVALEFDLAELITSRSINNAEPAVPITDIDVAGRSIVSNVVGVIGKLYALDDLERRSIEHVAGTAFAIGDKNLIELGDETNTLRLLQSGDSPDTFARTKV